MPPFPSALAYLWQAYMRIRRRMAMGFAGPNPIGWRDIDAFVSRSGTRLAPWEIAIIEQIDDLFVHREEAPTSTAESRPMTEELFDALFR